MFPLNLPRVFLTVYCDQDELAVAVWTVSALRHVRNLIAVPETEIKRWRRIFDTNSTTVMNGQSMHSYIL